MGFADWDVPDVIGRANLPSSRMAARGEEMTSRKLDFFLQEAEIHVDTDVDIGKIHAVRF